MKKPPRLFLSLFRSFCNPDLLPSIEGDLVELYTEQIATNGKRRADLRFALDVILLFRPGIIRSTGKINNLTSTAMIKSYVKIGWRNTIRNKGYSFINMGGLALGMAVAMIIGLWVYDELTYNQYYANYNRIGQVMKGGILKGKHLTGQMSMPYPIIEELKSNYGANFSAIVPIGWGNGWDAVLSNNDQRVNRKGLYIGEEGPEVFSWKMIRGNWSGLKDLHSIMISESSAKALFGNDDPMGKNLKLNNSTDVTVTGVYEDFPRNAAFNDIQFFRPWEFLMKDAPWIKQQGWDNHFLMVYGELAPNISFEQADVNIHDTEMRAIKDLDYMKGELQYQYDVSLLPMRDWHLRADFKDGELQSGPVQLVWFIGSIGVFVLLLACINFMNLATARSEKRAKEVGIRKAIGSVRRQLVTQFFSESLVIVFISFFISLIIVALALPWFNLLSGKAMVLPIDQPVFWFSVLGFLFTTGLLAGAYPALYLSSINAVRILKGGFRTHRFSAIPRKVLVVVQFTISVMLIACTGVIYRQLTFVKDRPVGYTREGLLSIAKKSEAFTTKADALRSELRKTGAVTEIAESGGDITSVWSNNGGFTWKGMRSDAGDSFGTLNVSPEFGKTVGWEFTDGRDFSPEMVSDSAGFVINESALKIMNLTNPVGETVHWKNRAWGMDKDFQILGVIKDMIMGSPFEPVEPTIYFTHGWKNQVLLRVTPGVRLSDALPKIERVFQEVMPEVPFDYTFVDQAFAAKFANEDRVGKLAAVFATLAIIISCLGLFGLASFVAEQRTKEIGIRKVMGASVIALWRMLSSEFVVLVVIASAIALPIAYYLLEKGLAPYTYKEKIGWGIFALSAGSALLITLLTVSFQSIKAALTNPVKSLRTE